MIQALCIINDLNQLNVGETKRRIRHSISIDGEIQELILGRYYTVWAIDCMEDGGLWVYIHSVSSHHFPTPYPAEFFELDASLPQGWSLAFATKEEGVAIRRISFPEWAHDDRFYERLVDADGSAVETYERWRSKVTPGS